MNGKTHALIGCASVLPAAVASGASVPEIALLTTVSVAFSLGPDIDHPNATVSRVFGRTVHLVVHGMSGAARKVTATRLDAVRAERAQARGIDVDHRALTHTLPFAAAMAGGAYAVAHHPFLVAALSAVCAVTVWPRLGRRYRPAVFGAALAVLVFGYQVAPEAEHVALAAAAGWVSHILADACTRAGVPLLWPMKVRGARWYRVRLLGRFITSGERKDYVAALGVALVMNLPLLAM